MIFAVQEISFIGHHVSTLGVSISLDGTEAIRKYFPPKDVKGVAHFVGMVNFYRKFIPSFPDIASLLNILRKKE